MVCTVQRTEHGVLTCNMVSWPVGALLSSCSALRNVSDISSTFCDPFVTFPQVARREYDGTSLQHLLEFMNNTYKHLSENMRSMPWDARARMPFRDHQGFTTFLASRFPLATLLVHALLHARNPAAPPPIVRSGAATRRNVLQLTTPERYQASCMWPDSACSALFFRRFRLVVN